MGQMARAVESQLPAVLEKHREQISRIAESYQEEVVKQKIVPLVRSQILPIIEREMRPVALDIGRELWDRVSLWSFTWRYLYDVSPLPERNAVRKEFERFLVEEIRPAMETRVDDFVAATERIVRAISQNPEVREVIRESLHSSTTDSQIQELTWSVFRDAFLMNAAVHQELKESFGSADAQAAFRMASVAFEPAVRDIGDAIFGNPQHPYTRMLLDAIPDLEMSGRGRTPVAGEVPNPLAPPTGCAFHPRCPWANERCRREEPVVKPAPNGALAACHAVEERRIPEKTAV